MTGTPFVLMHPECGKPALLLTERPRTGTYVLTRIFRHLDGSEVKSGEPKVCDSCGQFLLRHPFDTLQTSNMREAA